MITWPDIDVAWPVSGARVRLPRPQPVRIDLGQGKIRRQTTEDAFVWVGEVASSVWIVVDRKIDDYDAQIVEECAHPPGPGIVENGRVVGGGGCGSHLVERRSVERGRREALLYRADAGVATVVVAVPLESVSIQRPLGRLLASSGGDHQIALTWSTRLPVAQDRYLFHYLVFDATRLLNPQIHAPAPDSNM